MYSRVLAAVKKNTDYKILDFGCGGGRFVIYFLLLGYKNIYGVDLGNETIQRNNNFSLQLELFGKPHFYCYDGNQLPFNNLEFDIITSKQVIEHVISLDTYYSESSRVLNDRGILIVSHPHRLQPPDSHAQRWFIHYFPKMLRKYLYDWFTELGHSYYEQILNLKTVTHQKKLALKFFSHYKITTQERIRNFSNSDDYEGPKMLRKISHILMNLKFLGPFFQKIFIIFAQNDAMIYKSPEVH